MRKFLLFFAMLSVSIGTWADSLSGGGSYTVAGDVVTFSGTTAGAIAGENSFNFNGATRIKFDNTCQINKADLEKFLGTQQATYYVDLFDITNGTNTPMKIDDYTTEDDDNNANNIDKIIEAAVADMVTNGWKAKGIILPLNTGSGTAKVEMANKNGDETFTEYAVYYRDTQKTAAIYAHDGNMRYSWEHQNSNTDPQNHYSTAYTHLASHSEVANAETYIVSTNNKKRGSDDGLDLSNITGNVTKISIINDELVYKNQTTWDGTSRSYLAGITVEGAKAGDFAAAVANTGIKSTPCEKLIVKGPVSGDDVKAVNEFTTANGPLIYSLAAATGVTKDMLPTITNNKLEYLVLPYAMAAEQIVASDFSDALTASTNTNFKAAIAPSADKTKLSAYVKQAGSLGMARYYATQGSFNNNMYQPNVTGLTDVILSGNLNASDINSGGKVGTDGHWMATGDNQALVGLNGEAATLKKMDLENAVFADQYDMNFYKAGYEKLTSVILPTSEDMDRIPEDCFNNIKTLTYLCVPYNFKYIESGAFLVGGAGITRLTTTDANGAEIDNGPNTWTLSANIKELGSKPSTDKAFVKTVFPYDVPVTDVYCLAVDVPKCYANVFPSSASYGYGGPDNTMPYCRDRYYTNGNKDMAWLVLRFPSLETFNNAPADKRESSYDLMKQLYTDVDKKYTKLEQTGAVDANGDPILWPTRQQSNRVYNQASFGLTWYDWTEEGGSGEDGSVPGGESMNQSVPVGSLYTYDSTPAAGTGEGHYANVDITDYLGWHQIVLSQATYFEPAEEINEQEEIVRNYEVAGLYTFCIPYDMTIDEVCELMGVPASDDSKKIVNMFDHQKVTAPMMPEIYQLEKVTRYKGSSASDNNIVKFILSTNLTNYQGEPHYLEIDHNTEKVTYTKAGTDHPNRCLVGGRPYIIKAYKRLTETIGKQNLGMYVMTRNADKFDESASCVNNGLYEQLGTGTLKTLQFAIPYEQHKIQAVRPGESAEALSYTDDNDQSHKYYYTMVGQYWEQALPLYCIYMSNGAWYRYTGKTAGYKWGAYKCIIMPTQEINDKGGGYRSDERSQIPNITGTDLLDKEFRLGFLDGRDDDDFKNNQGAKYMFTFGDVDGIIEYDENGNEATSIKQLDGEELTIGTGKIYNMSGQYVGKSVDGLSRGMYIMNGKKFVVK